VRAHIRWLILIGIVAGLGLLGATLLPANPPLVGASGTDGMWRAAAPSVRMGQAAVWDPHNSQMLVFGGSDGTYLNDLWAYRPASRTWVPLLPTGVSPPPRAWHVASWDSLHGQMLIFGGYSSLHSYNDLWAYRPASNIWIALTPSGNPPIARTGHSVVWDAANAQLLLFGGYDHIDPHNDLWAYRPAGNEWVLLSPSGNLPPPRQSHTAIWDSVNSRMLVFGGSYSPGSHAPYRDLWAYSPANNAWSQLSPAGILPPAREAAATVWDDVTARMLVFGGWTGNHEWLNDVWAYRPSLNR
jgi:hypothetical protein